MNYPGVVLHTLTNLREASRGSSLEESPQRLEFPQQESFSMGTMCLNRKIGGRGIMASVGYKTGNSLLSHRNVEHELIFKMLPPLNWSRRLDGKHVSGPCVPVILLWPGNAGCFGSFLCVSKPLRPCRCDAGSRGTVFGVTGHGPAL